MNLWFDFDAKRTSGDAFLMIDCDDKELADYSILQIVVWPNGHAEEEKCVFPTIRSRRQKEETDTSLQQRWFTRNSEHDDSRTSMDCSQIEQWMCLDRNWSSNNDQLLSYQHSIYTPHRVFNFTIDGSYRCTDKGAKVQPTNRHFGKGGVRTLDSYESRENRVRRKLQSLNRLYSQLRKRHTKPLNNLNTYDKIVK